MYPELNFVFTFYQEMFHTEIIPLLGGPDVPTDMNPPLLPQCMQSIYWKKFREDQESKNSKEGKSLEIEAEKLNSFILKSTMEGDQLSSTSSLNQAESLYLNWKFSDANNSNAKIIGVGEEGGRCRHELMRTMGMWEAVSSSRESIPNS